VRLRQLFYRAGRAESASAGRSGCVSTKTISCPALCSAARRARRTPGCRQNEAHRGGGPGYALWRSSSHLGADAGLLQARQYRRTAALQVVISCCMHTASSLRLLVKPAIQPSGARRYARRDDLLVMPARQAASSQSASPMAARIGIDQGKKLVARFRRSDDPPACARHWWRQPTARRGYMFRMRHQRGISCRIYSLRCCDLVQRERGVTQVNGQKTC